MLHLQFYLKPLYNKSNSCKGILAAVDPGRLNFQAQSMSIKYFFIFDRDVSIEGAIKNSTINSSVAFKKGRILL